MVTFVIKLKDYLGMNSMFDTLLQLPLFQGLNQDDFHEILNKVKLDFGKYGEGKIIAKSGALCDRLIFLLKGEITSTTIADDESFTFIEHFNDIYLIEPYSLFGMYPRFNSTYEAQSEVSTVSIEKSLIIRELFKYEIFRFNYMNIISTRAQLLQKRLWEPMPSGVAHKIIYFMMLHAEKPEGEKAIKIKMEDLARHVDETRLNVSKALNDFQDLNLIELRRKEISIPDAKALLKWYREEK